VDLQESLFKELRDHAWEFDSKRIAVMLSATGEGPSDTLVDSAHTVLGKRLLDRPTVKTERIWYTLTARFLNGCVDACHAALDGSPTPAARNLRWYDRLKFVVHNKTTDRIENS
jgi:hypothetical protein